jgi:hypothetical protein
MRCVRCPNEKEAFCAEEEICNEHRRTGASAPLAFQLGLVTGRACDSPLAGRSARAAYSGRRSVSPSLRPSLPPSLRPSLPPSLATASRRDEAPQDPLAALRDTEGDMFTLLNVRESEAESSQVSSAATRWGEHRRRRSPPTRRQAQRALLQRQRSSRIGRERIRRRTRERWRRLNKRFNGG